MYSIVLMAAVAGGPDGAGADVTVPAAPAVVVGGCTGYGCVGVAYSCYGSCAGRGYGCGGAVAMPAYRYGCSGSACYGSSACYGNGASCYGASCHGAVAEKKHGFLGVVDRIRARRAGNGNGAGCMGTSCYGSSCYGSSCYGSACYGTVSYGCHGAGYGMGCSGHVYYGGAAYSSGTVISEKVITPGTGAATGGAGATTGTDKGKDEKGKDEKGKDGKNNEEGANIKFQLPPAAKLYVDGRPTAGEGAERAFFTPPLSAGQKYFYDVKAELVVDGKTVTEEKRVIVQAGAEIKESFPKLIAVAGSGVNVASK